MCPFLQFAVFVIIIAGRSQNADIILTMHIPGHRGSGGGPFGRCVVTIFSSLLLSSSLLVIQQESDSSSQNASESTTSQNRADQPPVHSPRHGFRSLDTSS